MFYILEKHLGFLGFFYPLLSFYSYAINPTKTDNILSAIMIIKYCKFWYWDFVIHSIIRKMSVWNYKKIVVTTFSDKKYKSPTIEKSWTSCSKS